MMTASARPAPGKRRKGPRPKHVPQRTCVACREQTAKRTLTRIVRTPEGTIEIDPSGKKNGRGAYLCDRRSCWGRGIERGLLARALNAELSPAATNELLSHVSSLPDETVEDNARQGREE